MARPTSYNPDEHPRLAREYAAQCKPKAELARDLGVDRATVFRWIKDYPAFRVAFILGRKDRDLAIERALFESAKGYQHPETRFLVVSDGEDVGSHVEKMEVTVHHPPNVQAIRMWLTNRKPKRWQDKQKVEHEGRLTLEQLVAAVEKTDTAPVEQPEGPNSG